MMYSRYFPGLQGIFVIFFWVVIWVLKIRRLLGYPKNHLKSMKIRWSINVFACFPMFSQATQHFFHGRWKITLLWPRYRHQRKYWADDARLQEKPGLKRLFLSEEPECQCVYLIWIFFRNCLKWDAFLKEKPSIQFWFCCVCPCCPSNFWDDPVFKGRSSSRSWPRYGRRDKPGMVATWTLGASSPMLFQ